MLKLLLLTLSTWSVVSCCFFGAVGLVAHRREQASAPRVVRHSANPRGLRHDNVAEYPNPSRLRPW